MRRRLCAAALLPLLAFACKGGKGDGTASSKGVYGQSYVVSLSRPVGGIIQSVSAGGQPDGKLNCGTASPTATANACGPATYAWNETARFIETPDPDYKFLGWAGDCGGTGGCAVDTRNYGADKWIVAAFEPSARYRGTSFVVEVTRPVGGTIRSDDGTIECGTAGGTANACGPRVFAWTATATLTAVPDAGFSFQGWSGDCSGVGACVLDTTVKQTDKSVAAGFSSTPAPTQPLVWDGASWDEALWQ